MMEGTIVDEWNDIGVPPPPDLAEVSIDPRSTALLVLDIQNQNCDSDARPRCVATMPRIMRILEDCRNNNMLVVYSLTRNASVSDIRGEVAPLGDEPTVKSGPNKFFNTDLKDILKENGIETLIIVGTSAHGAVLNTAIEASLRKFRVIVPVDGISATEPYAEQYAIWHLMNAPGCRGRVSTSRVGLIKFT